MFHQENRYKVCVICQTYNQASFITDTMNGFCIQKTTFPVVYCVIDDASTDGEPLIIQKFIEDNFKTEGTDYIEKETEDYWMTFAQHNYNLNCYFVTLLLKKNHFSTYELRERKFKYISNWTDNSRYRAYCEGDDFWVTPDKLQKQVDLLDKNPQVSLVATGYYNRLNGRYLESIFHKGNNNYFLFDLEDWKKTYLTKTLTLVFRPEACEYYNSIKENFKYDRDVHLVYYLLRWGPGIYICEATGVYNFHSGGICSSNSKSQNAYIAYMCYKELYNQEPSDEALRYLLFTSICLRLKRRLPEYNANEIYKEGLALSTTFKERIKLTRDYIVGIINK